MTKPRIEPPLTGSERAALTDLITRAARTLPTDSDRKRLIRLHNLDKADRKQERQAAGAVSRELHAVRVELTEAQATIAALHDGQSDDLAEQLRFLHANTLPALRREVENEQAGKARWRERAEQAEAKLATIAERKLLGPRLP